MAIVRDTARKDDFLFFDFTIVSCGRISAIDWWRLDYSIVSLHIETGEYVPISQDIILTCNGIVIP